VAGDPRDVPESRTAAAVGHRAAPPAAAAVVRDLLFAVRISDAAARAGVVLQRVDRPRDLPDPATLQIVFVDWADRAPGWGEQLRECRDAAGQADRPRLVLFGSHLDLDAHDEARRLGIGPVMARSRFVDRVDELLATARRTS
jgi:hypothetical protein